MILVLFTVYVGSCIAGRGVARLGTDDDVFTMILALFTVCVGSCVAGWSSQVGDRRGRVHDDPLVHILCQILRCRLEYPDWGRTMTCLRWSWRCSRSVSDPALQAGVARLGTNWDVVTMILVLFTVCVGSCVAGWSSQTGDRRRRVHDDPGVPFRAPPVCRVPGLPGQVRPADGVSDRGRDERRHQAGLPSYRSDPLCPTGVVSLKLISSSLGGNIVNSQLRWADTRQA